MRELQRYPAALARCPSALAMKLEALAELMHSRDSAAAALRTDMRLFGLGTEVLGERWVGLCAQAGGEDTARRMVASYPCLLVNDSEVSEVRMAWFSEALGKEEQHASGSA